MSLLASLIVYFVMPAISLLLMIFFAYIILSWLFILNIVSSSNPTARQIYNILSGVVDPIVGPVRKVIPPLGGWDIGFIFVAMVLYWTNGFLLPRIVQMLG